MVRVRVRVRVRQYLNLFAYPMEAELMRYLYEHCSVKG